jgi:hypothetical protein
MTNPKARQDFSKLRTMKVGESVIYHHLAYESVAVTMARLKRREGKVFTQYLDMDREQVHVTRLQ